MKKILTTVLAIIVMASAAMICTAADGITRDQLAKLLIRTLGLESQLSADFNDLSAEDAYAQMVSILANNGITSFNGTTLDETVTIGDLAQTLYNALSARDDSLRKDLSAAEMMQVLVDRGMLETTGNIGDLVTQAMLLDALNNPLLLEDIALAYQSPASSVE